MNRNLLKAEMVKSGLNAYQLCDLTGIGYSAFYRKMAGKTEFTQKEISAIALALHMSKETIFAVFFAEEVS